jgi:methionyl-tRNA synthetase
MDSDDTQGKLFYITTPIYYVNGVPHIGHTYTTVAADATARYRRLRGERVLFATGTDEHGHKVYRAAVAEGIEPQTYVDRIVLLWQDAWRKCHISYDYFVRTSDPVHVAVVQQVFRTLREQGDIYVGAYEGWYCVPCESYFREQEVVQGRCPDCHRPVETVAERAYFFRTSKYAQALKDHIMANPDFIRPEQRRNEVLSFIERGLLDNCISRQRSPWDIPVPDDETQSIYVWFDALVNYLTVAGYAQDENRFAATWPPDLQFMGKDILPRFHATIWPAMLMALGLPLPKTLFAHGWWMAASEDRSGLAKMSKSLGNVIDPLASAEVLAQVSGAHLDIAIDAIRYYILREVTFGLDGSFSMDSLLERFNADLANDLGNLLNRSLPLLARGFEKRIPPPDGSSGPLALLAEDVRQRYEGAMETCDFRRALETLWELVRAGNKFMDEQQPWNLLRGGQGQRAGAVLYHVLDAARAAAIGLSPVMPAAADEIWSQLGLSAAQVEMRWEDFQAGRLPVGIEIAKPKPIFPRVDTAKLRAAAAHATKPARHSAQKKLITLERFNEIDLRAG